MIQKFDEHTVANTHKFGVIYQQPKQVITDAHNTLNMIESCQHLISRYSDTTSVWTVITIGLCMIKKHLHILNTGCPYKKQMQISSHVPPTICVCFLFTYVHVHIMQQCPPSVLVNTCSCHQCTCAADATFLCTCTYNPVSLVQTSEEELFSNLGHSPAFEEFLGILGDRVLLRGFKGYVCLGQLV